ncbi:MAG: 4a-hydroxytetrahydrobiopterin dehydratase [candidate division Zixibacteria bacterium]|nr:4a-hydroxytetrahydrobiopterin dehydratase [candidate division Zixibacteria bacterium]
MPEPLESKSCIPCKQGAPKLTDEEITKMLGEVDNWRVIEQSQNDKQFNTLEKRFSFKDFRAAMAFLRQVEELAESQGHHPDFCVHYNKVDFTIWTHAIGGLHQNDFILASKIDGLKK